MLIHLQANTFAAPLWLEQFAFEKQTLLMFYFRAKKKDACFLPRLRHSTGLQRDVLKMQAATAKFKVQTPSYESDQSLGVREGARSLPSEETGKLQRGEVSPLSTRHNTINNVDL